MRHQEVEVGDGAAGDVVVEPEDGRRSFQRDDRDAALSKRAGDLLKLVHSEGVARGLAEAAHAELGNPVFRQAVFQIIDAVEENGCKAVALKQAPEAPQLFLTAGRLPSAAADEAFAQ
mgnify:CR=1 FL=1